MKLRLIHKLLNGTELNRRIILGFFEKESHFYRREVLEYCFRNKLFFSIYAEQYRPCKETEEGLDPQRIEKQRNISKAHFTGIIERMPASSSKGDSEIFNFRMNDKRLIYMEVGDVLQYMGERPSFPVFMKENTLQENIIELIVYNRSFFVDAQELSKISDFVQKFPVQINNDNFSGLTKYILLTHYFDSANQLEKLFLIYAQTPLNLEEALRYNYLASYLDDSVAKNRGIGFIFKFLAGKNFNKLLRRSNDLPRHVSDFLKNLKNDSLETFLPYLDFKSFPKRYDSDLGSFNFDLEPDYLVEDDELPYFYKYSPEWNILKKTYTTPFIFVRSQKDLDLLLLHSEGDVEGIEESKNLYILSVGEQNLVVPYSVLAISPFFARMFSVGMKEATERKSDCSLFFPNMKLLCVFLSMLHDSNHLREYRFVSLAEIAKLYEIADGLCEKKVKDQIENFLLNNMNKKKVAEFIKYSADMRIFREESEAAKFRLLQEDYSQYKIACRKIDRLLKMPDDFQNAGMVSSVTLVDAHKNLYRISDDPIHYGVYDDYKCFILSWLLSQKILKQESKKQDQIKICENTRDYRDYKVCDFEKLFALNSTDFEKIQEIYRQSHEAYLKTQHNPDGQEASKLICNITNCYVNDDIFHFSIKNPSESHQIRDIFYCFEMLGCLTVTYINPSSIQIEACKSELLSLKTILSELETKLLDQGSSLQVRLRTLLDRLSKSESKKWYELEDINLIMGRFDVKILTTKPSLAFFKNPTSQEPADKKLLETLKDPVKSIVIKNKEINNYLQDEKNIHLPLFDFLKTQKETEECSLHKSCASNP